MQSTTKAFNDGWIIYNNALWADVKDVYFSPRFWQQNRALLGQASGRGTTYFFRHQQQDCVLRHYKRGGLIARISDDSFIYNGLNRTRPWREFTLLSRLQELDLPAPVPLAARVKRHGFRYSADLITARIAYAYDLAAELNCKRLSPSLWRKIGETIARFHLHGVYHSDLNLRNIMIDKEQNVWLIDFDNARFRRSSRRWQQANLDRLLRSLEKEQNSGRACHWLESDWQALLEGYQQRMNTPLTPTAQS